MRSETKIVHDMSRGTFFDRKTSYMIPYDLGVTFGTVFSNFEKWIKRDLKQIKFNDTYIKTQITSDKRFIWQKAVLGQARRPCLSLQATIDHNNPSEVFTHPSFRNWDAISFLEPKEFTIPMISIEDEKNELNDVEFRISGKAIKFEFQAGIVANSRYEADNISNLWTTRRANGYFYNFPMVLDFKIPDEIMNFIADKFKLDISNHISTLKYINRNSHGHIYYAVDGYNGKKYYFFRYNVSPLIKVGEISNPAEYEVKGALHGDAYTFTRSFELEVLVPGIISMARYGDRINLLDDKYRAKDGVFHDPIASIVHTDLHERYIDVERIIENKHAMKFVYFTLGEKDLVKHTDGSTTSRKISLYEFLDENDSEDKYVLDMIKWSLAKGYKLHDIFNFTLYDVPDKINDTRYTESIDVSEDKNLDMYVPNESDEYKYYIKNMKDFFIVDLKPELNKELLGVIYIDLLVKNQYDYEISPKKTRSTGNDDLGIVSPYGPSRVDKGTDRF